MKSTIRRRLMLADPESASEGFTLIELLVVVIVIGILAAIALPVYVGVQAKAKESAVQSDVVNLKAAVIILQSANDVMPGSLPATTSSLNSTWRGAGATLSNYTTNVVYKPGVGTDFCVAGLSATGVIFAGSQSTGVVVSGQSSLSSACP